MCAIEDSLLLKGLQRSMISKASSRPGATVSAKGWTYSYGGTYVLNNSQSGILGLQGPKLASLVKNDRAAATFNKASATTPPTLGDPPIRNPSSGGA